MSLNANRRRPSRGFSLIEAMTAGVCLIIGLLGVIVLVQQVGRATSQADFNVQATKQAQQLLTQSTAVGYAALLPKVGTTDPCNGAFASGQQYVCTVQYIDTSPAGLLPLLGQPSILVRVTIERFPAQVVVLLNGSRRYIVEGYAIPTT